MRKMFLIAVTVLLFSINATAQFAGVSVTSVDPPQITKANEFNGKTTAELKTQSTFTSWYFIFVQTTETGRENGYPYLLWQSFPYIISYNDNKTDCVYIPIPQENKHDIALSHTNNKWVFMSTDYTFDGFIAVNNLK